MRKYVLGDMASTVYPVRGGLEDWAYGAGFDYFKKDGAQTECKPSTYALDRDAIGGMTQDDYKDVRAAIYLIETDDSKIPPEATLGARTQVNTENRLSSVDKTSI